jgi:ribosome maturation factor RimP
MSTWPLVQIQQLLEPTLAHMGYAIYALQQSGSGGRTLRIVIDKEPGFVSLDDCVRVSQVANPLLDQSNLIPDSYELEVSSPGAERELRGRAEYERFIGRTINVRYRSGEAEIVLEGTLGGVDDEGILVQAQRGQLVRVEWDAVIKARLVATL